MKFRKNTKSEKVYNEIKALKANGYLNKKKSKAFYKIDTLIRRAAKYGNIKYAHTKLHKIYWLEEFAPIGSLYLTKLIDKRFRKGIVVKNTVDFKATNTHTNKSKTNNDTIIKVVIDFNYWILLVILLLLLLLK